MSKLANTLIQPLSFRRKPGRGVQPDYTHPLLPTYGIKWDEIGNTSNYKPFVDKYGASLATTASGTPVFSETPSGSAIEFTAVTHYLILAANYGDIFADDDRASIVFSWEKTDDTLRAHSAFGTDSSSSNRINCHMYYQTSGKIEFQYGTSPNVEITGLSSQGKHIIALVAYDGIREIWYDGTLAASTSGSSGVSITSTKDFEFNHKQSTNGDLAKCEFFYVYSESG